MSKGCVLDLKMRDKQGSVVTDYSRYSNDGAVNGGVVWTEQGMRFDGSTGYLDCGNDASLDITDAITISTIITPHSITGNQHMVTKTYYTFFRIEDDELTVGLYIGGVLKYAKSTGVNFKIGGSYHVATTYDKNDGSNVIRLYINGVEPAYAQQDNTGGGSITQTASGVLIGKRNDGGPYAGIIDDPRIHNYALPLREIKAHYNATRHNYD